MNGPDSSPLAAPAPRPDAAQDRRRRRLLVGLASLFFLPVGLSFYLYYGHSALQPLTRVNHGDLVIPPRPLADARVPPGKWTFLYVDAGRCDAACRTKLYETRQVRVALDREMTRVQRVFVATGECCDDAFLKTEHPDLIVVRAGPGDPLLAALPPARGAPAPAGGTVYVVDPLGNLMMSYATEAKPKGLLEDMKRLLKLSHIG